MLKYLAIFTFLSANLIFSDASNADLVIYDLDFNTETATAGDYNPNYDQADPSGISTKSYAAGVGLDGSRALQVDFDTAATNPFSVSYFTNIAASSVDAPTSSNASDYTLSFDVRIEGFDVNNTQVSTQYDIRLNDVNFQGTLNSTANYQTVTASLGDLTQTESGGTFDLGDFAAGTRQFRVAFLGLQNKFDLDNNNTYFVDNIQLSQINPVPEPTAFLLFGAAAAGLGLVRRRRS